MTAFIGLMPLLANGQMPALKISENKRFLIKADGTPFFYLGDTAWELFHRLNREEADNYLKNRAAKGFTVIQGVVLAELAGLKDPNPYGHLPLINNDPTQPNEAYFEHVDYIVNRAAELGLYIGMLPTWGDKVLKGWPGGGPEIFTPENARTYGEFLGKRYQNKPIIWILGGDRNIEKEDHVKIWQAMAEGIKKGDGGRNLISYHPMGPGNSAKWFHNEPWLDFNIIQSGHSRRAYPNDSILALNYALTPVKPTIDAEPRYEDHPINWKPELGWFNDFDVRQAAYWAVLAGAFGHTYGNHNIWQMWQPNRKGIAHARTPWYQAIDQPGAFQMGYVRRLFESRPFLQLVPDQSLLLNYTGTKLEKAKAARAADGSYLFVYIPTGKNVQVSTASLSGSKLKAWWYNPRTGEATVIGNFKKRKTQAFDPPAEPAEGNDWILVLDDANRNFKAPGIVAK